MLLLFVLLLWLFDAVADEVIYRLVEFVWFSKISYLY